MFNFHKSPTEDEQNLNQDIIEKSKSLALKTQRKMKQSFLGNYKSAFTGEGLDYQESTSFSHGDSIRRIDWINTAKSGKLFVKRFEQTRQLKIMLIIDTNISLNTGISELKKDKLIEAMALLTFGAINNNDIVGQYFLGYKNYIPFIKGKKQSIRLIENVFKQDFTNKNIDYKTEFENFSNITKRKTLCFIFSDFSNKQLLENLKYLSPKHERIGVIIRDDFSQIKEKQGYSEIKDPNTGEIVLIDWSKFENFKKQLDLDFEMKKKYLTKQGVRHLEVFENADILDSFMKFFKKRN